MIFKVRWLFEEVLYCEITLRDGRVYYGQVSDMEKRGVTMDMVTGTFNAFSDATNIINALDFKGLGVITVDTVEDAENVKIPNWLLPGV